MRMTDDGGHHRDLHHGSHCSTKGGSYRSFLIFDRGHHEALELLELEVEVLYRENFAFRRSADVTRHGAAHAAVEHAWS